MSDNFKFNQETILSVQAAMAQKVDEFRASVDELKKLADEISSSSSWKDVAVKTSFISSINSYLTYLNTSYEQMVNYNNYLEKKATATGEFETNYSKG